MNSLVKFTKQYKASLIIAIAIIMFILFGFCPAVDVAGKAKICGLKILFEGDGLGSPASSPPSSSWRPCW